ncbi:hypothetical protein BsWGS_11328 [Bradybaena similaris]
MVLQDGERFPNVVIHIYCVLGPSRWGEISECCLGHKQSPRNLQSSSPSMCGNGQPTKFNYKNNRTLPGSLYNNGHDPNIAFSWPNSVSLHNAPYTKGAYILDNIHVHFCTEAKGSEHAIDGYFYKGEIHMVHYKASYGSVANAVQHEDGLVVIAIMLESTQLGRKVNPEMVKIIRRMSNLEGIGREFQLPIQVNVAKLFPTSTNFYTYHGSLTSPPCSESVRWIILREPIHVTSLEMAILRRLPNEGRHYIAQSCNDRPLQNGNTQVATNFACTANTSLGD